MRCFCGLCTAAIPRILAPRSPEKPPPRSLPLAFSSEQTIQPTRRTFPPMRRRFSTLPTPTAAATSMLSPALGTIIIHLGITTSWSGARSGFIRRPAKAITYKRQNRSTANISRRLRCAGPMRRQALRGNYHSRPTDKVRALPCGGSTLVELLGQLEIKESESNTRRVAWRGWTHGPHCAMQARPLFSPSSTPIRLKTLGVAIAISPVSRSIIFWERTPEGAATWSDLGTIRHAIPTIELPMVHHPLKARVPKSLQVQEEQSRHQQGQQDRKPQRLPRKARRRSRPQCRAPPFAKL